MLADGGSIPPTSTKNQYQEVSESLKTRILQGIAGFLLSHEDPVNPTTAHKISSRNYSNRRKLLLLQAKLLHKSPAVEASSFQALSTHFFLLVRSVFRLVKTSTAPHSGIEFSGLELSIFGKNAVTSCIQVGLDLALG